jgi:hypothetical protein
MLAALKGKVGINNINLPSFETSCLRWRMSKSYTSTSSSAFKVCNVTALLHLKTYLDAYSFCPGWSFCASSIISDTNGEWASNTVGCQLIFACALEAIEFSIEGAVMWVTKHSAYSIACNKYYILFHFFRLILLIYFLRIFTPFTFLIVPWQVMEHSSSQIMLY